MTDLSRFRRHYRTLGRLQVLLAQGKCPACELLLTSTYHVDCEYLTYQQVEIEIVDNSSPTIHSNDNGLTH